MGSQQENKKKVIQRDMNILFIEDVPDDVDLAVLELKRYGFKTNWKRVDSASELEKLLSKWKPDVILSDHSMPSFNGLEALKISRKIDPNIPFIFVSGTIGEEKAIDSILSGATDYVLKNNLRRLSTSVWRAVNDSIERRRAQEVDKERTRLAKILEATSDMVVISSPDDSILYFNQGAKKQLKLKGSLEKLKIKDIHADWVQDFVENDIKSAALNGGIWQGETVLINQDKTEIPVSMVVISHKDDNGTVEYLSFIARDIRDRKEYEKKIQYLANFDSLTELPNRTLLADRTEQAIVHSKRTKRSIAIIVINIDRFKLVNNGYGQEIGDELLKQFGARLEASVRTGDTVARLSADSFSILATELFAPEDIVNVVSKVQNSITSPFSINSVNLNISVGIGVSVYSRDGDTFSTLLQNAELAMHRSKEKEDNKLQYYASEMTRNASDRVILENDLRKAIINNELELYYQPQISLENKKMVGIEALMRWTHPERGMISPGLFIPIAENTDIILPMGKWALTEACRQFKEWFQDNDSNFRVSVNVSARQFRSHGFPEMVGEIINNSEIRPENLELELTESTLVNDQEKAIEILSHLASMGIKIALDDFGTGYSNLNYLSKLPIHYLKIDQSFVSQCQNNTNDAEIVRAIISLSEALNFEVIAEGIETLEQLDFLNKHNCRIGQGYLFSKPVPASQIPALFNQTFPVIQD